MLTQILDYIIVIIAGYFLGAIPFAVIIAKFCGVNIFQAGSGNPGATNVKRTCGKIAGNLCFILDALKGFIAAGFPMYASYFGIELGGVEHLPYIGLVSAIIGHNYSIFLKFKGGKGVATTIGGLVAIMSWVILIGLIVWLVVFYTTRYVSLASIAMALILPLAAAFLYTYPSLNFYFALLISIVIIVKHRSNIMRLMAGKENKF